MALVQRILEMLHYGHIAMLLLFYSLPPTLIQEK